MRGAIRGVDDGSRFNIPVRERLSVALIVVFVGAVGVPIVLGWQVGLIGSQHIDLEVYRFGVEAWWNGDDFYGQLPATSTGDHLPFLYPPFSVLALSPLAILPWMPAVLTLFALNVVCVAATLYVVARSLWPRIGTTEALVIASPAVPLALLLEPLRETFSFGQVNLILMGLVAVDCLARKTFWPRGMGVGLAAAIKLTPAAFLLFFLVRRDFRPAAVAALTAVIAAGIGFLVDVDASVRYWFGGFGVTSGISGSPYLTNQTIEASLTRYELAEPVHTISWAVLTLSLLITVIFVMRRSVPALALMFNAGLALLASPTSWSHHWVWIAPALLLMAGFTVSRWQQGPSTALPWFCTMTLAASLYYLAPFHLVPSSGDAELTWSITQQFLGNSYTWFTVLLIAGYAVALLFTRDAHQFHPDEEYHREHSGLVADGHR